MNTLYQYLVPYLISQVVAVVFIMIAYKSTTVTRLLFAIIFLGASAINFSTGLSNPDTYLEYSKMALPFYREFINGWFSHYNHIMVPLIAAGQFVIGIGMLLSGWWVRWACLGAILFLIGITPLMIGSAFPFSLIVSYAAWIVLTKDNKDYLWKATVDVKRKRVALPPSVFVSWIAWMLTAVATTTGLFANNVYRDNEFVQTAWRSNDWITLLVVIPGLFFVIMNRTKMYIQLIWAGILGYLIYNYAFYLLGAAFNVNFLVYAGIIGSSIWSLVALLQNLPVIQIQTSSNYYRWISGYLFLITAMLIAIEVRPSFNFMFTGSLPDIVVKSNHPTSIVYALDLTLIVPTSIVAGYWLWKRKPWGIILSAIMLVKATFYGLVLCAGTILLMINKIDNDPLLPVYIFIAIGGFLGLVALIRSINSKKQIKAPAAGRKLFENSLSTTSHNIPQI